MIQRRSLLAAMLAASAAPAFVRAGVLMPVRSIIVPPELWVDYVPEVGIGTWEVVPILGQDYMPGATRIFVQRFGSFGEANMAALAVGGGWVQPVVDRKQPYHFRVSALQTPPRAA